MSWCAAYNCNSNSKKDKDVMFFKLPSKAETKSKWIQAINRTELPNKVFVCSKHFEEKSFDASWDLQTRLFYQDRPIKRKLVPDAVPTLFSHKKIQPQRESSVQRKVSKERQDVNLT